MKRKIYVVLPIFNCAIHGIRIDSGINHSDFLSIQNTDEQKRSGNNIVKLTNVNNLLNKNFIKVKKQHHY